MQKKTELALSAARVAAEEASAAKSQFLANMSHEIRTPLNGIVGMTELALGTNLDAEQRDYLEMVLSSADALLTVVNDILDFSKMQAKGPELQIRSFVLRDLLTDTMKPLIVQGREKGLQIICDVAGDVPRVLRGDPDRLRQVFVNLISNAIKFTDRGSVSVGVEVAEQNETGAKLHMYVRDTGIGIPEDKCDLIFEAFAQAEDSNTRRHGGTGLGLAISSKLAEAMNGRLGVESIPGSGSTFHFEARFGLGDEQGPQGDSEARRKELESVSHYS
jgi:protein-histidine pros-kinase